MYGCPFPAPMPEPLRTPLYDTHVALGGKMVPYGGFAMPVQYRGIVAEHLAVRTAAGLFDVSHMGEVLASGPQAFAFVQHLVTNDVSRLVPGKAMYAAMCHETGGIVDDLLVYQLAPERYLLVVNASNIGKDWAHMNAHNPMGAALENLSARVGLLALQGPKAFAIFEKATGLDASDIPYYHFRDLAPGTLVGSTLGLVSHTGYTGEPGLELYVDADKVEDLWNVLLAAGDTEGLVPAGLGARDTLRLEAGFSLYGNDLTDETTPLEAGLGWITKLDAGDFVGRDALLRQKEAGVPRRLVAFAMEERCIPRHGQALVDEDGAEIGVVTSGTQSPVLGRGIGLGYVPNTPAHTAVGAAVRVAQRGTSMRGSVRKPPLHKG